MQIVLFQQIDNFVKKIHDSRTFVVKIYTTFSTNFLETKKQNLQIFTLFGRLGMRAVYKKDTLVPLRLLKP